MTPSALFNIRVVEFTVGQLGPMACRQFALFGAEVIKVESMTAVDGLRMARDPSTGKYLDPNAVPRVNYFNLNKKSIALNLKRPEAVAIAKRLIAVSDVLIENFSAGVIDRLGLGYEDVRKIRSDLVMASASGSGREGPEAGTLAIAPIFSALSGVGGLTGYPDDVPHASRGSADALNGMFLFYSVLGAIFHRQRTGRGQYIDYSAREGLSCLIGDSLMAHTLTGQSPTRAGNQDDLMAPHNCYRCKGTDKWISIAAGNDEQWRKLVTVMGNPDWAQEARFATAARRKGNEAELDKLVDCWTIGYGPHEAMAVLQGEGVAAFPSFTGEDVFNDRHLQAREVFQLVEQPRSGPSLMLRCPWRLSATPPEDLRPAPAIGEHTESILRELLGLSQTEIVRLKEAGVTV